LWRQIGSVTADLPRFVTAPLYRAWHLRWGATNAEVAAAMQPVQLETARPGFVTSPQPPAGPRLSARRRTEASSFQIRSTTGTSSPGIKMPTTIVFFEVSIPRWIGPAPDVKLGMTADSLPP
jgi:hypothetical protein